PDQRGGSPVPAVCSDRLARGASSRFYYRDPVVGPWAADRLRERDAAAYLSTWHASGELPDALDDLRQTGGRERMAPRLEAAGRIDRQGAFGGRLAGGARRRGPPPLEAPGVIAGQASFERGLPVERRRPRLARREEPDVLERDELERRERVVDLGDVATLRPQAGHREARARGGPGGAKAGEALAVPEAERVGPLPDAGHAHGRSLRGQ